MASVLRLEGVSCGYGAVRAVDGLSFEVPKGTIFALLGPNGAGKTSIIMAIAGHVEVQAGLIRFDGTDITRQPAVERVRLGMAIVPEGRRLFVDLSVDENLIIGGYSRPRERTAANRASVFELFPHLADRRRQQAGSLSGGEQQMLAIGRALMAEPRLLLVDEVSLGLMPKMVDICYRALAMLKAQGLTILLVEQNTTRALNMADTVFVLASGRGVYQGSGEAARNDPTLIEAYLGLSSEAPSP